MEDETLISDEWVIVEPISAGELSADDSPMSKRLKPTLTRDRLSELPDLAIVHILSHLHLQEAVRTSVLSTRFNSLWNSVTGLNFSDDFSGKSGKHFINFIDNALIFHHRCEIEKFSVEFCYNLTYSKAVNRWIKFATKKQVKLLHLNLRRNSHSDEHKLPKYLYNNENLVELVTNCCKFTKVRKISWNSLRLLSITGTKLNEGLIARVLSGCPVLETLELRDWSGFDRLKIVSSVSLKVLRIVGEQVPKYQIQPQDECLLEISGPNLVSLEILGPLYRTKVRLMDLGSLVSATMDFETKPQRLGTKFSWCVVRDEDIAREVLESLCLVNKLTVGGWFIKVLSKCEAYNLSSPWSDRKSLTLSIPVINWDHLGISSLLHSSPHLETLVIRLSCGSEMCGIWHSHFSYDNSKKEYYWSSWSTISKCPLEHLKTVKVVNFQASCGATKLFRFLQFLLKNSRVLEEVVIQASQFVTREALDEAMKLLSFRTASADVVVLFEPPHFWVDPLCIYQGSAPR